MNSESQAPGTVYLVGAGPGDPGLLTVRAMKCLGRADLVLYDYLVNPSLVEYAAPTAELVRLGHHTGGRSLSPDEITAEMVAAGLAGRTVVRLKGGDPSIFARGAEEAEALREAGIPFEIVPGITAGLALAAYAEIPLTHHEHASAVALVTARERSAKGHPQMDYAALAAFPGTLVFYMGVKGVGAWSQSLIEHGKSPDTPVAVVRWCSRARQQTIRCKLGSVTQVTAEYKLCPPALFAVGDVVDRTPALSWFEARPLIGSSVLVAGTAGTAGRLRDRLAELGAEVMTQPVSRVTDPKDWAPADAALDRIASYDWLVLSSPNGVDRLLGRLFDRGGDVRGLAGVRLAVRGAGAAERVQRFNLRPDLVPQRMSAEAFARVLVDDQPGTRVLMAGAGGGNPTLATELTALGAEVERVPVYRTVDVAQPDANVAQALADGEVQWIAVTSGTTAKSLASLYGDALGGARIASLSPLTSQTLRDLGFPPAVEATKHTVPGLVDAIAGFADA